MNNATSFGGPFVLLPQHLADEWSEAMGDCPEPDSGLYGEVCGEASLMHKISFRGTEVLRVAEEPGDLFWYPTDTGGLVIQWIAADSIEQLVDFARNVSDRGEWQERLEFVVVRGAMRIMDSCGFDDDGQPKIDVELTPGKYLVEALYAVNANTMATVFRFTGKDQANQSADLTATNILPIVGEADGSVADSVPGSGMV